MRVWHQTKLPPKIGEVNPEIRIKLENTVLFIWGYSPKKRAIAPIFPRSRKLELCVYAIVYFCRCSTVNLMYSAAIPTGITQLADGGARSCSHSGV